MPRRVAQLLDRLLLILKPYEGDDVPGRLRKEMLWLKQELANGNVLLPIKSTNDLFLGYVVGEAALEGIPHAQETVVELLDALMADSVS
jgi:hypothetical protein